MRILASIALVVLFVATPVAQDAGAPTVQPGTYRLLICAEPCAATDAGKAAATAIVVIIDPGDQAMRAAWDALPLKAVDRKQLAFGQSACFKVTQQSQMVGAEYLHFGITKNAVTYAVASAGRAGPAFSMRVYQSIDASYELRWTGGGPMVRGEGWSAGADIRSPIHRNAYFAAERTGDPDPAQCK